MARVRGSALSIVLSTLLVAGCSALREDIQDAQRQYEAYADRYQVVADAVIDGEAVPDSQPDLYQTLEDWTGANARAIFFGLEFYGLAGSGRRTGLAYYQTGSPPDEGPGGAQRAFQTCNEAAAWFREERHSLQVAYCRIAGDWWAYQIST